MKTASYSGVWKPPRYSPNRRPWAAVPWKGTGMHRGEDDQTGKDGDGAAGGLLLGRGLFPDRRGGRQNLYLCTPDNAWTLASGGARSISITDMAPVTADSGLILVVNPSAPIHLTRVYCAVQGSGSVAMNLDKRAEEPSAPDSERPLLGPDLTATNQRRKHIHISERGWPVRRYNQLRRSGAHPGGDDVHTVTALPRR